MRHPPSIALLMTVAVLGGGCCSTVPKHDFAPVAVAEPGRLHPGDELVIDVEEYPPTVPSSLRLDRTVQADGTVALVSNKVFRAAGKTLGEFRQEVRAYYVPKLFKSVCIIDSLGWFAYYVVGEVRYPSRLLIGSTTTLRQAIAGAGGFTPSANKTKVQLIRADGERCILNCSDSSRPVEDVKISAGDYIVVPRR